MDSELVRIEKLTGAENWCIWKFQVKIILNANDLLDVIDQPQPNVQSGDKGGEELLTKWKNKDKKAQKIIATTMSQQPLLHIMNCTTAASMWKKLEAVYEQRSETNIHMLQQKFYSITKDPNDDIATHISKIETIAQQIRDRGDNISTTMVITKILMTLPASFSHFCSAWESTVQNEKTIENLTARLVMEESRMSTQTETQENTNAFVAKRGMKYNAQQKRASDNVHSRKPGKCFLCNKYGHWKRECPTKKNNNNKVRAQGDAFICNTKVQNKFKSDDWFLDSGASDHMCFRQDWFINYEHFNQPQKVRVGNGDAIYAVGRGDINILAYDDSEWVPKYLSNVLYVPDIQLNLFSSNAALDKNLKLISDNSRCKLLKDEKIVAIGVREGSLFKMMFKVNKSFEVNVATACKQISTWHKKLAHQNLRHIRDLLKVKRIEYLDTPNFVCEACLLGKQHRLPFGASECKSTHPGELVHVDLCGPMQESSIGGSKYFILFKDNYSKYRTVYFLKEKTEVLEKFSQYVNKIKIDTGYNLETVRSDNGLEFVNKEIKLFFQKKHIRHQTTVPYSPQQNGKAEREMRTLVEAARTMIYDKNLPLKLWAEAINMAAYVLNLSSCTDSKDKSPAELWFKKTPNINLQDLKVFGTECFMHVPKEKRRKWDAKSKKGIFVGYPENSKGFRIWIPTERKIEISRDVFFIEEAEIEIDSKINESYNEINLKEEDEKGEKEMMSSNDHHDVLKNEKDFEIEETERLESCRKEINGENETNTAKRYNLRSRDKINHDLMTVINEGCAFVGHYEPVSYEEACKSKDVEKWQKAMQEELTALQKNETWKLVELPEGKKIVDNKWVYKIKDAHDDHTQRFKARLVARGFSQQKGVDYQETFSPVAKFNSIRMILNIAAAKGLKIKQFDIKTAFLNGNLDDEIYMKQPQGFEDGTGRVCKLNKSLYGLKQASRVWNKEFTKFLINFKMKPSKADPSVFIAEGIILALYIDDGLIAAQSDECIEELISYLKKHFEVKVFEAELFLGIEINRLKDGSIHLGQGLYIDKVLKRFKMNECKSVSTPADSTIYTSILDEISVEVNFPYREAVGSLMYLAIGTRPDISFALGVASRHLDKPTTAHINIVKRIMRYLKGTKNFGIKFSNNSNLKITYYSDADYAGDMTTRRSTSGYICLLWDSPVSWASQQQKSVALSTTEAEYVAAALAVADMTWLKHLYEEIESSKQAEYTLCIDNQSAIKLIKNPEFHKRSKHIEVRHHFIREKYAEGLFQLQYVASTDQIADIFTKPLSKERFELLRNLMKVLSK